MLKLFLPIIKWLKSTKVFKKFAIWIENIVKNSVAYLTIDSDEMDKIKNELDLKIVYEHGNTVKYINNLNPNELMEKISKYQINKLLIEEVSIEDLFMEYYM